MLTYIETITARHDGTCTTFRERVNVLNRHKANAFVAARAMSTFLICHPGDGVDGCWCYDCSPIFENDFGEMVVVCVAEYDEVVPEGIHIEQAEG